VLDEEGGELLGGGQHAPPFSAAMAPAGSALGRATRASRPGLVISATSPASRRSSTASSRYLVQIVAERPRPRSLANSATRSTRPFGAMAIPERQIAGSAIGMRAATKTPTT
jgi:hypothetical protein